MTRTYFEEVQTFRENRWALALVIALKLRDGQKILLGTQNPEGLERAMKKLMATNETI